MSAPDNPFAERLRQRPPTLKPATGAKKKNQKQAEKEAKEKEKAKKNKEVDVPAIAEIENRMALKEKQRAATAQRLSQLPEGGIAALNSKPAGHSRNFDDAPLVTKPLLKSIAAGHTESQELPGADLLRAEHSEYESEVTLDPAEEVGEAPYSESEYASGPPTSGDEDEVQSIVDEEDRAEVVDDPDSGGYGGDQGEDDDDMDPSYQIDIDHDSSDEESVEVQKTKGGRGKTSTSTRGHLRAEVTAYRLQSSGLGASQAQTQPSTAANKRKHDLTEADNDGGKDARPVHFVKRAKNAFPRGLVANWKELQGRTASITPQAASVKSLSTGPSSTPSSRRSSATSDRMAIDHHGGFQDDEQDKEYHQEVALKTDKSGAAGHAARRVSQMPVAIVKKELDLSTSMTIGRTKKTRYSNKHLPVCTRDAPGEVAWKTMFLPTIISYCGCLQYSWTASTEAGTQALIKRTFLNVFGNEDSADVDFSIGGPVHYVTMQRLVDYRHGFATTANAYLKEVLTKADPKDDKKLQFPTQESRAQMIAKYRPGYSFLYSTPDFEEHQNSTGIFRSSFYLVALAYHFKCAEGALPFDDSSEESSPPIGAMALAAVAIERAFKAWTTGKYVEPDDFSYNNYKKQTVTYANHIARLEDHVFYGIISEAYNVHLGKKTDGNAHSTAVTEGDSDNEREQLNLT
ncbi:hypothetical protein FB107DRAFT_280360 [Schizophyllum commune]